MLRLVLDGDVLKELTVVVARTGGDAILVARVNIGRVGGAVGLLSELRALLCVLAVLVLVSSFENLGGRSALLGLAVLDWR